MEGMYLQSTAKAGVEHRFTGEEQKLHRVTGRLLELMLDRADSGVDPALTRDVVFERLISVKDSLPDAQAALDVELELHPEPIADQWGWDTRK
jgi:hypothetical protein